MFDALVSSVMTAAVERATLVANHVIASEPEAVGRLGPHAGRCIALRLDRWPAALPTPPALRFLVTPAGLLEWRGALPAETPVDLSVRIDAANPAALAAGWAAGRRPRIDIDGDARFAADLNWLLDHLRWDVEDDLARLVGPAAAQALARAGRALVGGLRLAARRAGAMGGDGDASGARPGAR